MFEIDIKDLLKFLKIDKKMIIAIENYKKDTKVYGDDLANIIIKETLFDYEFIKKITNHYKNATLLKKYIGTSGKDIENVLLSPKANSNYFKLFTDLLISSNVTPSFKKIIGSAIKNAKNSQINNSIKNINISKLLIEDFDWLLEVSSNIDFYQQYDLLFKTELNDKYKNSYIKFFIDLFQKKPNNLSDEIAEKLIKLGLNILPCYVVTSGLNSRTDESKYTKDDFINKVLEDNLKKVVDADKFLDALNFDFEEFKKLRIEYFRKIIKKENKLVYDLLKKSKYQDYLEDKFFEKAEQQLIDLKTISETTFSYSDEELEELRKDLSFNIKNDKYNFLSVMKYNGKNIDYTVNTFLGSEEFFEKLQNRINPLLNKIISIMDNKEIDYRLLKIFNNEGNMTGHSFVKHIIYFVNKFQTTFYTNKTYYKIKYHNIKDVLINNYPNIKNNELKESILKIIIEKEDIINDYLNDIFTIGSEDVILTNLLEEIKTKYSFGSKKEESFVLKSKINLIIDEIKTKHNKYDINFIILLMDYLNKENEDIKFLFDKINIDVENIRKINSNLNKKNKDIYLYFVEKFKDVILEDIELIKCTFTYNYYNCPTLSKEIREASKSNESLERFFAQYEEAETERNKLRTPDLIPETFDFISPEDKSKNLDFLESIFTDLFKLKK